MNQNENQIKKETSTDKSLAGNKQNTGYQLKSWHIALGGIFINTLIFIYLLNNLFFVIPQSNGHDKAFAASMTMLAEGVIFVASIIILSLALSLKSNNEKIKKNGAIISIIWGSIIILLDVLSFFKQVLDGLNQELIIPTLIDNLLLILIIAFFPFVSGLYYFWKKV